MNSEVLSAIGTGGRLVGGRVLATMTLRYPGAVFTEREVAVRYATVYDKPATS